jgi:hypothetical protein
MTSFALSEVQPSFVRGGTARRLVALAILVVLGDLLFFEVEPGAGMAVLAACIAAAAYGTISIRPMRGQMAGAAFILLVAQVPWLLSPGWLSFCLSFLGTGLAVARLAKGGGAALWPQTASILKGMMWRIVPELYRVCLRLMSREVRGRGATALLGWLLPAFGGALFLALFAGANPIIASSLSAVNPLVLMQTIDPARVFCWLLLAGVVWPFLAPPAVKPRRPAAARAPLGGVWASLLGVAPISRALVLFNLLFAVQTSMDAAYLWGGAKLPAGFTYADYAHRGAYPLILTALLAGGFAILATRPGTAPAASQHVRLLVLFWIVQNLALVGSSIYRLHLYVQVYSLSELRLAAFLWMLLVFAGLVLIVLRILLARSDAWLLRANTLAALVTLYLGACLNFPWIVATYDVNHCLEVTGAGTALDLDYLQSLGPQAIPALDRYQVLTGGTEAYPFAQTGEAGADRARLAANFKPAADWRSFSFWSWVLHCYLVTHSPRGRGT